MKMRLLILGLGLFLSGNIYAQEVVSNEMNTFKNANKAYADENYDVAIAGYNQILKSSKHSAEVYFNLGNAHYKKNQVGPAIYNYEKALQLDPKNEDVLNNLRFANQMKIDSIESLPENSFGNSIDNIAASMSIDEWAYTSIVLVLINILLIILYIYAGTSGKKRLFFILSFVGIVFSIMVIIMSFYAKDYLNNERYAIVYVDEFKSRSEPKQNSDVSFTVHEGTKVEILQEFDDWYEVVLANGSKAWMPKDTLQEL